MTEISKVAVFGGGFNPPTLAHQAIINALLEKPEFDEVWAMPSGERQDKQLGDSDESRLAMLHLMKDEAFPGNDRLVISDFELRLPRPTRTCKTVGALALAYPKKEFWFAFGADAYASMPSWQGGIELQKSLHTIIIDREGEPDSPQGPGAERLYITACEGVSSTEVRKKVVSHKPFQQFVCSAVQDFIVREQLYVPVEASVKL